MRNIKSHDLFGVCDKASTGGGVEQEDAADEVSCVPCPSRENNPRGSKKYFIVC